MYKCWQLLVKGQESVLDMPLSHDKGLDCEIMERVNGFLLTLWGIKGQDVFRDLHTHLPGILQQAGLLSHALSKTINGQLYCFYPLAECTGRFCHEHVVLLGGEAKGLVN